MYALISSVWWIKMKGKDTVYIVGSRDNDDGNTNGSR